MLNTFPRVLSQQSTSCRCCQLSNISKSFQTLTLILQFTLIYLFSWSILFYCLNPFNVIKNYEIVYWDQREYINCMNSNPLIWNNLMKRREWVKDTKWEMKLYQPSEKESIIYLLFLKITKLKVICLYYLHLIHFLCFSFRNAIANVNYCFIIKIAWMFFSRK